MIRVQALKDLQAEDLSSFIILTQDGVRIIEPGEPLTEEIIEVLGDQGYDPVVLASSEDDAEEHIRNTRYRLVALADLAEGDVLGFPICDEEGGLMLDADTELTADDLELLRTHDISGVFLAKEEDDEAELRLGRLLIRLQKLKNKSRATRRISKHRLSAKLPASPAASAANPPIKPEAAPKVSSERRTAKQSVRDQRNAPFEGLVELDPVRLATARIITDPAKITPSELDRSIDAATASELEEEPEGEPLSAAIQDVDPLAIRPKAKVDAMVEVHESVIADTEQIFAQIRARDDVSGQMIASLAANVVRGLVNDRALLLNLAGFENSPYYLVSHAINTTLLSVNLAAALGFSSAQIQELAYGALLHDIGMARMPAEILNKSEALTPQEWLTITTHPVVGLNILQSVSHLPKTAPLVVYQENERIDGSGYPKKRSKGLIHTYAKIVQVASGYDAMISRRPYRKAKLPYHAMAELLKQVSLKKYDAEVVRAMIASLGLFPVGSWVRLNDNSIARVVAPSRDHYTRPVISIVVDRNGTELKEPHPLDLNDPINRDLKIAAPVRAPRNLEGDVRSVGF